MAITVTHPFVSAIADGADATVVRPSNWNATHSLTGTVDVANGGTGASTTAGAPFALKGANTDLTSVVLTSGTVSAVPSVAFDLANKAYVDTLVAGLNFHVAAQYATAAALAANTYNNGTAGVGATLTGNAVGALTVDSNVVVVAQRILVKNEVAGANNGVYVVTTVGSGAAAYVLTRADDYNTVGTSSNQIGAGDYIYITAGTVNINTAWVQQTPAPITIGTTSIVFIQFGVTGAGGTNTQVQFNASGVFAGSANLTFNGTTLAAAAITASTTLGVTGVSTLTGGAVIQGLTVGLGANAVANNTAVGVSALASGSLSGANNTGVGQGALTASTSGNNNTAVGMQALAANTGASGYNNTALGQSALSSNTGGQNLALGQGAGSSLTTGSNNTIIGSVAGTAGLSDTVIIAAGSAERMRINSSGQFGFGVTAPGTNFDAVGPMYIRGAASAGALLSITPDATSGGTGVNLAASFLTGGHGPLIFSTSATTRMTISAAGAVSIPGNLSIAAYTETIVASGTVGSTATLAITAGTVLTATLTASTPCTFAMPTSPVAGQSFILRLTQAATGMTTATFTGVKWPGGTVPTITATASAVDIISFVYIGTAWYGNAAQAFA
jgi:hypothetical protein